MFEVTLGIGEEAIIDGLHIRVVRREIAPYRHHYRCFLCEYISVLEFEPDAAEPNWTECHNCGFDNEIPPGPYDRPAIVQGFVPSQLI